MPEPRPSLLEELKRRRVVRVGLVYAVVGLGVIEAADLILPRLGLPDWTVTLVVVLTVLGFPAALALAWAFDVTPRGVKRAPGAPRSARIASRRWAAAVVTLAVLVSAVVVAQRVSAGPAEGTSPDVIAVLPFAVRGSPDLAYLGEGMVSLLGTKLDGVGGLRSVDARALLSHVAGSHAEDPEVAAAAARRFGAGRVILGDIVQGGERLQLSATLYRIGRDGLVRLADGRAEGAAGEVFALVDDVAAQLLAESAPGQAGRLRRIAALTTTSLDAFRAYVEGENAFRAGQYAQAAEHLEHAVRADSTFALAWYRLSLTAEYRGLGVPTQEAAAQALRHGDRLADRDRRMLEAFMAWRAGDSYQAERLYRAHVAAYPDDVEAWFELAEVLFHLNPLRGRSYHESEEAFRRVMQYEPGHMGALIHLARTTYARRDLPALDSLIAVMEAEGPSDRSSELRALHALAHRDSAAIRRVLDELHTQPDGTAAFTLWVVGTYGADADGSEAIARVMIRPDASSELRALGHVARAYLRAGRGRWRDAMTEMEAASRLDPTLAIEHRVPLMLLPHAAVTRAQLLDLRDDLLAMDDAMLDRVAANQHSSFSGHDGMHRLIRTYNLGLVSAELGDAIAADSLADALEEHRHELERSGHQKTVLVEDFRHHVRARALLRRGRTAEAMAELDRMRLFALYPHIFSFFEVQALERYTLAEAQMAMGRHEEALPRYRNVLGTSTLELALLAPAHLRQAEIHERAGRREEAARHYRAFLALWDDPDPELVPTRDAARRALQRLRT